MPGQGHWRFSNYGTLSQVLAIDAPGEELVGISLVNNPPLYPDQVILTIPIYGI
jgi:hypothetical protein